MAIGGFLCIGAAACVVSGLFPEWVRRTFEMSEWNFPKLVCANFGWCMLVGLPFMIMGGWAVLRIAAKARRMRGNAEQSAAPLPSAPADGAF